MLVLQISGLLDAKKKLRASQTRAIIKRKPSPTTMALTRIVLCENGAEPAVGNDGSGGKHGENDRQHLHA
jgi:hypothetical protein